MEKIHDNMHLLYIIFLNVFSPFSAYFPHDIVVEKGLFNAPLIKQPYHLSQVSSQ